MLLETGSVAGGDEKNNVEGDSLDIVDNIEENSEEKTEESKNLT